MNLDKIPLKTKNFLFSTSLVTHPPQRFAGFLNLLAKVLPSVLIICLKKFTVPSKYSRKISAQQFLIRANTYLGSRRRRKVKKHLKVALWLIGDDLPSSYKRLVLKEFFTFIDDPCLHKRASDSLAIATQSLASNSHPIEPDTWFFLSRFLNSFAFMNAAFIAREQSANLRRREVIGTDSSRRTIEAVCAALFESLDFSKGKVILNEVGQRFRPDKYSDFNTHLKLVTGKSFSNAFEIDESIFDSEPSLRSLIYGKRVSLVGPGSPVGDFGQEIDQADIVFRIKHPGKKFLSENQYHGIRCDIAQYTNLAAMELILNDGLQLDYFDDLKAVVVLNDTDLKSIEGVPVYFFDNLNSVYRTGDLTTGTRCLVNLLKLEPAFIKLFGFDFYAGVNMYDVNRVSFNREFGWTMGNTNWLFKDSSKSFSDRVRSFLLHDQIANFSLARNLYRAERFEIEPFGREILRLTPGEYSDRIECVLRQSLRGESHQI